MCPCRYAWFHDANYTFPIFKTVGLMPWMCFLIVLKHQL
uniref:Uncharacterized protein n=1 Tax=Rhizophora mucronata TaxID=61149 RepID=A0A2P2K2Q2_RHIMU